MHLPWSVSSDSPASPAACRLYSSEQEDLRFPRDQMPVSSPCLNLDELSSSDNDPRESVGLSDLSITLLCDSEVIAPVDSDQVLADVDLPLESVVNDKRQVIRIRDVSPDVVLLDDSQVGRAGDSHRPVRRVAAGKCMPAKVSTAISRAPLSLDMTVKCTAGVASRTAQPPAVTSHPAISTATVTSREVEICTGTSDVAPVRRLEPNSVLVGEGVPAVAHSSPPLFESPDPVPVVESGPPDVELPSSPSSGQSSYVSSQTLAWEDAGDSSVPLSPNRVQEGSSQDAPDEGSLFNVSPISPGFLFRPSRADQQLLSYGLLLPTMLDDFNVLVGEPITYTRCEPIPGSDSPTFFTGVHLAVGIHSYAGPVVGSDCVGFGDLLSSGGVLCCRSSNGCG